MKYPVSRWRKLICKLFGHGRVQLWAGEFSCMRCLVVGYGVDFNGKLVTTDRRSKT